MWWVCTNWEFDAEAVAAWGTWAAVLVALFLAHWSSRASERQRKVEARLLAALLFHEVAHSKAILDSIAQRVLPIPTGELAEHMMENDRDFRRQTGARINRIFLPALAQSVNRLSVLPSEAAIAVGEMQSNLSFLLQAGKALETEDATPPADFYKEFCWNIEVCISSTTQARLLLRSIAFPNGRPTKTVAPATP